MTLDELLNWADERAHQYTPDAPIAIAILDMLGETQPCGYEPPAAKDGLVVWAEETMNFSPSDARWLASALLRAAEEAERYTPSE